MAKSKKRKQRHYPKRLTVEKPVEVTFADIVMPMVVRTIGCVITFAGLILAIIELVGYIRGKRLHFPSWVIDLLFLSTLLLTAYILGELRFIPTTKKRGKWDLGGLKAERRQSVWMLRASILILILEVIQVLGLFGYITKLTGWIHHVLPYRWINENFSYAITHLAGIALSGILGNTAYALLRGIVKKFRPSK